MNQNKMATSDRKPYLLATNLTQELLDECSDNLENELELVADIETPDGYIYASDRNKYKGNVFYEALVTFPIIKRTLGLWLAPVLEFSSLELNISNVDERFNKYLPGGSIFGGWIGKSIDIKLGLKDIIGTYFSVYKGKVIDIGGFKHDRKQITLISRDFLDIANKTFPTKVLTQESFSDIEEGNIGLGVPIIYGDWTINVNSNGASIPAFVTNGLNANVISGNAEVSLIISDNDNKSFLSNKVYLKRGDAWYNFDQLDITVGPGNKSFIVKQEFCGGITLIDSAKYIYAQGDLFYCQVIGKELYSLTDNIVQQALDILITYGNISSGDFDINWTTFRDKVTPAESAINLFKSRIWLQESQNVIEYALSLLEQIRLEMFVSRELKYKLVSLHFDNFEANPSFDIKNWDIVEGTFQPELDDVNAWNRAQADYDFDPISNKEAFQTPIFRNSNAITQAGKEISKKVIFPNLYESDTVIKQLKEMIKLASSYAEFIPMSLTSRAVLQDLGNFVKLNIKMGSLEFYNVPAMIREIGYDPSVLSIPIKVWSFQMTNFPGYLPGTPGIVGGYDAIITQEL
jgi:hypothetical protein